MISNLPDRLVFLMVGALLPTAYLLWTALITPTPYSRVKLHVIERVDPETVRLTFSFLKRRCHFDKLAVVGNKLGLSSSLPWNDVTAEGEPIESLGDRIKGHQTWRLQVKAPKGKYDTIEIRTRHICGGSKVDRVFAKVKTK